MGDVLNKLSNAVDNIVGVFKPLAAIKRKQAREFMSNGRYDSGCASSSSFINYRNLVTDADTSVAWDRTRLVSRSRDAVRNIPVATGLIKRICDHAIGDRGLNLHPQINRNYLGLSSSEADKWQKQAAGIWDYFSESKFSDFKKELNIAEKTYLTLQSELEGGDCFTLLTKSKKSNFDFDLSLQSLEGEFVSNPDYKSNSDKLVDGIVKNELGQATSYWFSKYHPGSAYKKGSNAWSNRNIYDANQTRRILHHMDIIRFGQTRGVPVLGPVFEKLLQLGRLSKAELDASVINSFFSLILQGDVADTEFNKKSPASYSDPGEYDKLSLGAGSIMRVSDGTKIDSFDSKRPNLSYISFFEAMVAEIGASAGVPKSLILMSFDKSYSASRGEVLLAWVYFLSKRTHMAVNFCQPVYEALIDEAVAKDMISAPGYFTSGRTRQAYLGSAYNQWTGPTRPAIDELKEAKAHELYNSMGTQSLSEITAKTTGKDWMRVNDKLMMEHKLRVEAGLEQPITTEEVNG